MEACNLCGGTVWETFEQVGTTRVVGCACGLVFVTPQPTRAQIEAAYAEEYYGPWEREGRARSRLWERRIAGVEADVPVRGRLLDVGCGTGAFLEVARRRGWEVAGTELSGFGAQQAQAQGLRVVQGELWEATFPDNAFDAITCWHVLEHVTNPWRVIKECYRVLRPGGWLHLATPNLHDHIFRLAYWLGRGHRPRLYDPQEREVHLYFFSQATVRRCLSSAGFDVAGVGFDRGAAIRWPKRWVDQAAYLWYRCTGLLWGMALEVRARKPGGVEREPR